MELSPTRIHILVHIVDNYGDMGFICELIESCQIEFGDRFKYVIWTNSPVLMHNFLTMAGIENVSVHDSIDFGYMQNIAICIVALHAPLPVLELFSDQALILRIDYVSLDPIWIQQNEREHICSTANRQIIELIPSPLLGWAGLIPIHTVDSSPVLPRGRHITIFIYPDTIDRIDWSSFPDEIHVFVFGKVQVQRNNITEVDFLPTCEYYSLLDSSEFVIVRGEVTFVHAIQSRVPFFWNLYSDIGWFPNEQSLQYLDLITASWSYREVHAVLNGQKTGKLTYMDLIQALSDTPFSLRATTNLIHTMKKHIDRFYNSI